MMGVRRDNCSIRIIVMEPAYVMAYWSSFRVVYWKSVFVNPCMRLVRSPVASYRESSEPAMNVKLDSTSRNSR